MIYRVQGTFVLVFVHLFIFAVIEVAVLCIASHKRHGNFTQVVL